MPRAGRHLGERLHAILLRAYGMKDRDFSHDCVDRVMAKLNAMHIPEQPMTAEVLWLRAPMAFTLPGQCCYISRQFIERCSSDAPAAFALAHEIAHHDLGHLRHAEAWAVSAAACAPLRLAALTLRGLARRVYSREMEFAADARALVHCRMAGFDPRQCLAAFDILAGYLLDHRNLDAVYGTDDELELDPSHSADMLDLAFAESKLWWTRHRQSHPAINQRRDALLAELRWWDSIRPPH
jgi:predicted Zn-dependent protease